MSAPIATTPPQREPARKTEDAADDSRFEEPEGEAALDDERDDGVYLRPREQEGSPRPRGGAETPGRAATKLTNRKPSSQTPTDGRRSRMGSAKMRALTETADVSTDVTVGHPLAVKAGRSGSIAMSRAVVA